MNTEPDIINQLGTDLDNAIRLWKNSKNEYDLGYALGYAMCLTKIVASSVKQEKKDKEQENHENGASK